MSNISWLTQTVTRSRSVAPAGGFGMGDVCPQATAATTGFVGTAAVVMAKRHLDAIQVTPGSARTPWSPPVT